MKKRMNDEYSSYEEERKIECFDYIIDIYQEKELSWQKRASMIMSVIWDYLNYRTY